MPTGRPSLTSFILCIHGTSLYVCVHLYIPLSGCTHFYLCTLCTSLHSSLYPILKHHVQVYKMHMSHAHVYMSLHTCQHTCTHAYIYAHVYTHVYAHIYAHVHSHVYAHIYAHVYAHVYADVYVHAYANVYGYAFAPVCPAVQCLQHRRGWSAQ